MVGARHGSVLKIISGTNLRWVQRGVSNGVTGPPGPPPTNPQGDPPAPSHGPLPPPRGRDTAVGGELDGRRSTEPKRRTRSRDREARTGHGEQPHPGRHYPSHCHPGDRSAEVIGANMWERPQRRAVVPRIVTSLSPVGRCVCYRFACELQCYCRGFVSKIEHVD